MTSIAGEVACVCVKHYIITTRTLLRVQLCVILSDCLCGQCQYYHNEVIIKFSQHYCEVVI